MKKLYLFMSTFLCLISQGYAQISIDVDQKHQEIDNFAASDAWVSNGIGQYWSDQKKEQIAELLFDSLDGIGLSGWRFNIGAGSAVTDADPNQSNYIPDNADNDNQKRFWRRAECFQMEEDGPFDWSKQAGQQYFLREASTYGVKDIIAFLNSPPSGWATKNGHAQCDGDVGSTNLKEGYEGKFAEFMVEVVEHFRDEGININYLSPINEPTWEWNFSWQEGCRYNNDEVVAVINAVYAELDSRGLAQSVAIDGPEVAEYKAALDDDLYTEFAGNGTYEGGSNGKGWGDYKNYIKLFLEDEKFRNKIGNKVAVHGYFADNWLDAVSELRDLMHENMNRYSPDAKVWMSEYSVLGGAGNARDFTGPQRDLGMNLALHTARLIHRDLTRMNASAWQWWTAMSRVDYKDGLLYTDWYKDGDAENLWTSKTLWTFGNFSRFIRPDYIRVEASNPDTWDGLMGSAYISPNDEKLVVVLINNSNSSITTDLSFDNLPNEITAVTPYTTSNSQDLEQGISTSSISNYTVNAESVVTLAIELGSAPPPPPMPVNPPSNLVVTDIDSDGATLSWTDNSDNESGFRVELKNSEGTYSTVTSVSSFGTSTRLTGLSPETAYTYRVQSYNALYDSASSDISFTTIQEIPEIPQSEMSVISVSSEETVGEDAAATNAIDGDASTFWHSNWVDGDPYPHEIIISLGSNYEIHSFGYLTRQDGNSNGVIKDFEFYVSSDGTNWGTPKASGSFSGTSLNKINLSSVTEGAYIKFVALSEAGRGPNAATAELTVQGNFISNLDTPDDALLNTAVAQRLIEVFPNPSINKQVTIKANRSGTFHLVNLSGQVVMAGELTQGTNALSLAVDHGMYLLEIQTNDIKKTVRLIVR